MKKLILSFLLIITCLFSSVISLGNIAFAETKEYSNVLDDLQKDKKFNKEDYPVNNEDYSLQVIQVAESEEKELFVYIYQPCTERKLRATSINISTEIGEDLSFYNYQLTYINLNETLFKYKVNGLKVSSDQKRYYEISSVFRAWNKDLDKPADKVTNNTIDEVSYKVGKAYTFNVNELICQDIEIIEITSKFVGFVRYRDGFILEKGSCDSHFLAFTTEKKIERLMEADVCFMLVNVTHTKPLILGQESTSYGEPRKVFRTLTDTDYVENKPILGNKHNWNRIEDVETFIEKENLEDEIKQQILNKEWVLRFCETTYGEQSLATVKISSSVKVNEVTILRLKFETEGQVYNLGTLDNKQTGDENQSNKPEKNWFDKLMDFIKNLPTYLKAIIYIMLGVLGAIVIVYAIKLLIKLIEFFIK